MPAARHCRHCLGDCPGNCLIGDSGRCIHGWNAKRPGSSAGSSWRTANNRRRIFWGIG